MTADQLHTYTGIAQDLAVIGGFIVVVLHFLKKSFFSEFAFFSSNSALLKKIIFNRDSPNGVK